MNVTYYNKSQQQGSVIATFGISIPEWHMVINNLAIIKAKSGGWFIVLPTYKRRDEEKWSKIIVFDREAQNKFCTSAKEAVEKYAAQKGEVFA